MTREALAQAIRDAEPIAPRPPCVRTYITTTAAAFGVRVDDMLGQSRKQPLVDARHVAMALVYADTLLSFPQVGAEFDRDHTTVVYAIDRVQNTPQLASWAAAIRQTIEADDGA